MRKHVLLSLLYFFSCGWLFSQSVAHFSCPDTLCPNISFKISNQSTNVFANDYYWNFATGNLVDNPDPTLSINLGVLDPNPLNANPIRMCLAQDIPNNKYYLFYTSYSPVRNIIRVAFTGSYLDPAPVVDSIPNSILPDPGQTIQGISVKYDSTLNEWFCFYVTNRGGGLFYSLVGNLMRVDLGNSLSNDPLPADIHYVDSVAGHLLFPQGIDIVRDRVANKWYCMVGFTGNFDHGYRSWSFARYEFDDTLTDVPVHTKINEKDLGAVAPDTIGKILNSPASLHSIQDKNGNWYTLLLNMGGSFFTRVYWGNSLSNAPSGQKLPNMAGVSTPYDFQLVSDCEKYYAPIISGSAANGLSMARFDSLNSNPSSFNFGNVAGFSGSNGMTETYRMGDTIVCFSGNSNHSISRIVFVSSANPNIPKPVPANNPTPTITYVDTGSYQIRLAINAASMPTMQSSYCKLVKVVSPPLGLPPDTAYCYNGSGVTLTADSKFYNYTWRWLPSDSAKSYSISSNTSVGTYQYILRLDSTRTNGCYKHDVDTFNLDINPNPAISTEQPFYMQVLVHADSGTSPYQYAINSGAYQNDSLFIDLYPGTYLVSIRDTKGCVDVENVTIERIDIWIPNYFTPNGDGTHDQWYLRGIDNFPKATIKIYDRYGVLLATYTGSDFESKQGWDGIYQGRPMPSDDYWYFIDLKDGRKPYTGHVTLKR